MQEQVIAVSAQDSFCFACHPELPCFNECCADLNQFLYPYDILRLKNHLGLPSREFLRQYTDQHIGPESGLPVITLRPSNSDRLTCPFVTECGCRVYADRPASCRMYPLVRALSCCRNTGRITERFAIIREAHCRGFESSASVQVRQWLVDQGLADYNRYNDTLLDLISLKNRRLPGPLDLKAQRVFHLALYDLDTFRHRLFDDGFYKQVSVEPQVLETARNDDTDLLVVGMQWVKASLFGDEEGSEAKRLESRNEGLRDED